MVTDARTVTERLIVMEQRGMVINRNQGSQDPGMHPAVANKNKPFHIIVSPDALQYLLQRMKGT
ncbi:hypothetical protein NI40_015270 [Enterobacter sp. E20]|nr:hypothetical protein NI40_015270 [Enterobacter sp. E20]